VAEDPLDAALAAPREAITAIPREFGVLPLNEARASFAAGNLWSNAEKLLAAVDAVLEMHAQTAFARYTEPCARHLYVILPRRDCRNCVKVERAGCQRCRDENGHPAKPEDCAERNAIFRALTGAGNAGA
jgi:hypothetical protein